VAFSARPREAAPPRRAAAESVWWRGRRRSAKAAPAGCLTSPDQPAGQAVERRPRWSAGRAGLTFVTGLVALGLLALALALVAVPRLLGGMSLTVLTGSMEPGIRPGDVVVTRGIDLAQAQKLRCGDIITFLPYPQDPTLVTHRIVAITSDADGVAFITQGDNNDTVDSWGPVRDYQVRGQVLYHVPKLGWVRQWAGHSVGWIIPISAAILFLYAAISLASSFRRPGADQAAATSPLESPPCVDSPVTSTRAA